MTKTIISPGAHFLIFYRMTQFMAIYEQKKVIVDMGNTQYYNINNILFGSEEKSTHKRTFQRESAAG